LSHSSSLIHPNQIPGCRFCGKYADVQALPSGLRVDVTETGVTRTRLNPDGHVTRFGGSIFRNLDSR
jgi:hypothetical protein